MMNGTLTVTRGDHVAIHTHTAAETAWRATSHLIELATQLILVDTPAAAGAHERGARPRNGTGQAHHPRVHQPRPPRPLRLRRPHDVPAYAPASVARLINEAGALQSLGAYALTGHADVQTVSLPRIDRTVDAGEETIDSIRVSFEPAADAESGHQLTIGFPDDGVLIAQDIVYNRVHACLGEQGSAPTSVDSLRWGRSGQAA